MVRRREPSLPRPHIRQYSSDPMKKEKGRKKLGFRREFSAGGVVFRKFEIPSRLAGRRNSKFEVKWLIGKHSGYHKWVLPKGLIEEGERGFEAALREVEEEMGVKCRILDKKPIYKTQYVYWADYKAGSTSGKASGGGSGGESQGAIDYEQSDEIRNRRRVAKYQESGGKKTKVFKLVSFYLMEYEKGNVEEHGWEMEDARWLPYDEALEKLAFAGEREALEKARDKIQED